MPQRIRSLANHQLTGSRLDQIIFTSSPMDLLVATVSIDMLLI